jgi:hypothetical protein
VLLRNQSVALPLLSLSRERHTSPSGNHTPPQTRKHCSADVQFQCASARPSLQLHVCIMAICLAGWLFSALKSSNHYHIQRPRQGALFASPTRARTCHLHKSIAGHTVRVRLRCSIVCWLQHACTGIRKALLRVSDFAIETQQLTSYKPQAPFLSFEVCDLRSYANVYCMHKCGIQPQCPSVFAPYVLFTLESNHARARLQTSTGRHLNRRLKNNL